MDYTTARSWRRGTKGASCFSATQRTLRHLYVFSHGLRIHPSADCNTSSSAYRTRRKPGVRRHLPPRPRSPTTPPASARPGTTPAHNRATPRSIGVVRADTAGAHRAAGCARAGARRHARGGRRRKGAEARRRGAAAVARRGAAWAEWADYARGPYVGQRSELQLSN